MRNDHDFAISYVEPANSKRLSHGWQCDMIFIKRVVVRYHERARNERVSDITPTRVDKIMSQCHPCDYLFIIYHNTRTNRNFVNTYHSHIYYTSTHCHFLTLQITVCLSCQTQQAMHNALCDVLWPKNILKKNSNLKKIQTKKFKKNQKNQKKIFFFFFKNKISQKQNFNIFPP